MAYTEPAYAKLNLTLDILGRREDGYHDMRMVMQSIDLQDLVTVTPQAEPGFTLTTNLPYLPRDGGNIAVKAANQFFQDNRLPVLGMSIDIKKNIPVCAGMAGGSSDGAAVLRLLRQLCLPELPQGQLEETGGRVGSDVPYCVRGGTALAEGRGEALTDLPPLPPCWIAVCKPPCSISTPELFAQVRVKRLRCHPDTAGMLEALSSGDLEGIAHRLYNVFEDILPRRYAQVFEIKAALLNMGAMAASMTGSGPTVFGLFPEREPAARAVQALSERFPATFMCRPAPACFPRQP